MDKKMFGGVGLIFIFLGLVIRLIFKDGSAGDIAALLFVLAGVLMVIASVMTRK